ncbi:hypothetical protein C7N83_04780 [Neisseria iguanae]|uniref:Uncharacterized protein n=1 Tax=Neisseria iguanae TaxID=90242 RepID=A0A2P7U179_9NEIS|nr:hypothetical protein C7N83_04780 [Neisseria iguanae]
MPLNPASFCRKAAVGRVAADRAGNRFSAVFALPDFCLHTHFPHQLSGGFFRKDGCGGSGWRKCGGSRALAGA